MRVRLISGNVCIASKELKTQQDFDRISGANMLILNGRLFRFSGVHRVDGELAAHFDECDDPIIVDGFIEPRQGDR